MGNSEGRRAGTGGEETGSTAGGRRSGGGGKKRGQTEKVRENVGEIEGSEGGMGP